MAKIVRGRKIDTVVVLLTFCLFAASVLMALLLGAGAYKKTAEISLEGYDEQTCLSYIWTKVKNGDELGRVYISNFYGLSVLCLEEEHEKRIYQTMIYQYDGWVREIFCEKNLDFLPEDGRPVIEAEALVFEQMEDGLIRASSSYGNLLIFPRCNVNAR